MTLATIVILAIGLSMDAFAVAVCKGIAMPRASFGRCLVVGLWFGVSQGMMSFAGYILGIQFETYISAVAPWLAFGLLGLIGIDMIKESFSKEEDEETESLAFKEMFLLAIATSIDALAVGITFVCVSVKIVEAGTYINTIIACGLIALITFVISMVGVNIGHLFGNWYKNKAEFAGGAILVLLGAKILIEHVMI